MRTESAFLKTSINYRNFHMLISKRCQPSLSCGDGGGGGPSPSPSLPGPRLEAAILCTARLGWDFLNYF